jgi:hypothetical protein
MRRIIANIAYASERYEMTTYEDASELVLPLNMLGTDFK